MNSDLLELLYSPPSPQFPPKKSRPDVAFTYREINQGYRPGRGLGLSFLFHLGILAILVASRSAWIYSDRVAVEPPQHPVLSTMLYLPTLGGGSEGDGHAGGGEGHTPKISSGLRSRSRRGFAYPGPQPMVSSPPRAVLGIQTILQPALINPPVIKQILPLPNIIKPAVAPMPELAMQAKALVVKPEEPIFHASDNQPIEAPKLRLPATVPNDMRALTTSKVTLPEKPLVKPALPRPPDMSDVHAGQREEKGLLVMNAIPPAPDVNAKIPHGEARSLFAISPAEATIIAEPAAGTIEGEASSPAAGSGSRTDPVKGDAIAEIPSGGNAANRAGEQTAAASGNGSGGRYGAGTGSGLNASTTGAGTGRGAGSEAGVGAGSGTSRGSGAGAGSSPGTNGFPGIAIQGGRYGSGNQGSMIATNKAPVQQKSYNMTIVATANSGGGLQDLGVFDNEKVYTVYIDMRANDQDTTPSWTLQYAVLQPAGSDPADSAERVQGTPTTPFAMLKEVPEFPADIVRKYRHQMIVASAILQPDGKLEQVAVRQSPEPQLAEPLIEALQHWLFEPGKIDGKPVALKVLLGIRLAASH